MKIYGDKLAAQLKQQLQPVYLISGDEPLLVQEAVTAIRNKATAENYSERHSLQYERGFDWQQLLEQANSLSLFADRKLIELRLNTTKIGDQGSQALQEYIAADVQDAVLVIVCPKLDAATQRVKWVKAIEKAGTVVQIWPVDTNQLPRWVQSRAKQKGLEISGEALSLLVERVEGNLLAATQEIEKLWLINGPGIVDAELVRQSITDSSRFNVYNLVDSCLAGQVARAVHILDGLQGEGVEPVLVLWALTREIRTLTAMSERLDQGLAVEAVLNEWRVWERRKSLIRHALQRYTHDQWSNMLLSCESIDRQIKGLLPGRAWDSLLRLSLTLAGKPVFNTRLATSPR